MKNDCSFQWDPNSDQTYDLDCSTKLEGHPSQFNKAKGISFTMNAPGQTLTLQVTDIASQRDVFTQWEGDFDPQKAQIDVLAGTVIYDGGRERGLLTELALGAVPAIFAPALKISGTGNLVIQDVLAVACAGGNKVLSIIDVKDVGGFSAECQLFTATGARWTVADQATMSISIGDLLDIGPANGAGLDEEDLTVLSTPAAGHSLHWKGGEVGRLWLHGVTGTFASSSRSLIEFPLIDLNATVLTMRDRASVSIRTDKIAFEDGSEIVIQNNAGLTFQSYSGKPVFDPSDGTSFDGAINFDTSTGPNAGVVVITDISLDGAKRLVEKGLFAVDDQTQHDVSRIAFSYSPTKGYALYQLK